MDRWRRILIGLTLTLLGPGCGSLTPRNFRAMMHPAPVVRAGAVGKGDDQPDWVAYPAWIARLDDKDAVVRMAANESLKGRSGQDFGFIAWAEPAERATAVAKWKAWWLEKSKGQRVAAAQGGLVRSRGNR
jgi:hypothetical protein